MAERVDREMEELGMFDEGRLNELRLLSEKYADMGTGEREDFLAAGFTEEEIEASGIMEPKADAQPEGDGSRVGPDSPTLRERHADRLAYILGGDDYDRDDLRMAQRFTGTADPSAAMADSMGAADFTPLGALYGGEEGYRTASRGYKTGDAVTMGLGAVEAGLAALEALPVGGVLAKGARRGIERLTDDAVENYRQGVVGSNVGNVGRTDAPFDAQRGGVDAPPQDITESDFGPLDRVSTRQSEDVAETAANITTQMRDNIVSLYDLSDELGISTESAKWYDGARRIAGELSDRFRVPRPKTSAVLAVLSPQKDWYQNVALGERLIKHHTELTPDVRWSSAMDEVATTPSSGV